MDDVLDDFARIATRCERAGKVFEEEPLLSKKEQIVHAWESVALAWSGSFIGYQAYVYTADLRPRRPGEHFDTQWGMSERYSSQTNGDWREYSFDAIDGEIRRRARGVDLQVFSKAALATGKIFEDCQRELVPTLDAVIETHSDSSLKDLRERAQKLKSHFPRKDFANARIPSISAITSDMRAIQGGLQVPHHISFEAFFLEMLSYGKQIQELGAIARHAVVYLQKRTKMKGKSVTRTDGPIFIGHGRSMVWMVLKEFLVERLQLEFEEFNRESIAGRSIKERLLEMLDKCCFAFLVMTAEDEQHNGKQHARQNVVHEVGLFQGRYGFERAIVLLEDGCEEFSNLHGIGQIRFPKGNMKAVSEDIRGVLEREGLL